MKRFLVLTDSTWKDYNTIKEIRDDWYFELSAKEEVVKVMVQNKYGDYVPNPLVSNPVELDWWTKDAIKNE